VGDVGKKGKKLNQEKRRFGGAVVNLKGTNEP